ncbi:MAG: CRISPR-associated protein Cas4 [Candidatus Pacearchaeota archaeon]|nr:CRISPR-associated protein Cas4 [Candidatus Pacearchaeota archaeon]
MIKELIEEFYKQKKSDKEKNVFYVSDAGKCPRAVWFSLKGYPKKELDARTLRVLEHGDYTHMRIIGALFSLGLVNAVEVEIPNNDLVHGRADAIISIKGEPYVVEIKSVNSAKFKKEKPDPAHVKQLQLYLYFFKMKKGILIYENKDTQELKEFVLDYDEETVREVFSEFNKLKELLEKNVIPDIPKELEDWRCDYCPYIEECEKIEEEKLNQNVRN